MRWCSFFSLLLWNPMSDTVTYVFYVTEDNERSRNRFISSLPTRVY